MSMARTVPPFDEKDCLSADPFAGDFGMPGDKTLQKKIVRAAKDYSECDCCLGPIFKGERCRIQVELFDGEIQPYRWCVKCCRAMAMSWDDEGRAWTSRERLRDRYGLVKLASKEQKRFSDGVRQSLDCRYVEPFIGWCGREPSEPKPEPRLNPTTGQYEISVHLRDIYTVSGMWVYGKERAVGSGSTPEAVWNSLRLEGGFQ